MISFKPMKPHLLESSLTNQEFSMSIFKKYGISESGFFIDIPLVFLRSGEHYRNDGISRFFMDIKLQISALQSIQGQQMSNSSIYRYYLHSILKNQELNLNVYNRHNSEVANYERAVTYRRESALRGKNVYALRDNAKYGIYLTKTEKKLTYRKSVSVYGEQAPGMPVYSPIGGREAKYGREAESGREAVSSREAKSSGGAEKAGEAESIRVYRISREYYRAREYENSREFVQSIITRTAGSIGSSIVLKEERIWRSVFRRGEHYRSLLPYGRLHTEFRSSTEKYFRAYGEHLRSRIREATIRKENNNTLVIGEYHRATEANSYEHIRSREYNKDREYYRYREINDTRELRVRELTERMAARAAGNIGGLIALREERTWNSIYRRLEHYRSLLSYSRLHTEIRSNMERYVRVYGELVRSSIREAIIRKENNNTLVIDKYHRDTEANSYEHVRSREYSKDREYYKYMEINNTLVIDEYHRDTEANSYEHVRSREYNKDREYYRYREINDTRELRVRELTERMAERAAGNIGSRIALREERIWNNIFQRLEPIRSLWSYSRLHAIFGRSTGRDILAFRETQRRQPGGEGQAGSNGSLPWLNRYYTDITFNDRMTMEKSGEQPGTVNYYRTAVANGNSITTSMLHALYTSVVHGSRNISEHILRALSASEEPVPNRTAGVSRNIFDSSSESLNIFRSTDTSYSRSYLGKHVINLTDSVFSEKSIKRNITMAERLEEKLSAVNLIHMSPLLTDKGDSGQVRHDYAMGPPSMDNIKSKGNNSEAYSAGSSAQPQLKAQVDIELPKKEEVIISKNQIDRIVNKVFTEIEKKIQFERYRRGL